MNFPFEPDKNLIIVPTHLIGPAGETVAMLALDTGASYTLVNQDVLEWIGYDPSSLEKQIQITTGSGVERVPRLPIRKIEALGQIRENVDVICHTLPKTATIDGVLGLNFLRGLKLTLDFRAGLITLK